MADPLLTSLCAICHVSAPKYKCPRCDIRTCSLGCVKKHKAWSECSGERDPTAYVPRSKLRTPAGVDHDYNFLHSIEMASERAERILVGDRGIVRAEELRPLTVQEVRWKTGRDGRKRKVLVTRVVREAKGRAVERFLANRLRRSNVVVEHAPLGMERQKENNTTLNRRTGRINWQVEWFTFDQKREAESTTTRALSKVMDDVPLYEAYHTLLEDRARAEGRLPKRTGRGPQNAQSPSDSRWQSTSDTLQDPSKGTWVSLQTAALDMWPEDKDEARRRQFQFFLARQKTRADAPMTITRLEAGDSLRSILTDTRVVEFPTIYVLKEGEAIPSGFVLGPKDTVAPEQQQQQQKQQQQQQQGNKRKGGPHTGQKTAARFAKRRRPDGKDDVEEGEVASDEGEAGDSDGEENDGEASGHKEESTGLEAGDVIAEESIGEEEEEEEGDDDEDEDDDSTSSSGSDSD